VSVLAGVWVAGFWVLVLVVVVILTPNDYQ